MGYLVKKALQIIWRRVPSESSFHPPSIIVVLTVVLTDD